MAKIILLGLVLLSIPALAEWQNPSERYIDAYKQYLNATCPIERGDIRHFVYFARDRSGLRNHPLLAHSGFAGAQIMYPWRLLEPEPDQYDFSVIREDMAYLRQHGKQLFIQLQDATFDPHYKAIPDYLASPDYDGGAVHQYNDAGEPEGWVAKRWNPGVRRRFAALLTALGEAFDGEIAGLNLQESAVGVRAEDDPEFTPESYLQGLKANMAALGAAFDTSTVLQYANFTPDEWLPWEDKGQLRSLYRYGEEIGVGLGAPDLMVRRKGQLNHALAIMHEHRYSVPLAIAVQDGNYIGQTGTTEVVDERQNIVPLLHAFARDFLKVDYMFWANQPPYFAEDVLPCFSRD